MSASSVRRIKERGGGGSKVVAVEAAPRAISPLPEKSINVGEAFKRPAGIENSRPTSRVRAASGTAMNGQKPLIRPMPRIEKSVVAAPAREGSHPPEPRARWSTSSVPRGRSSSPSDFCRGSSESRKNGRVSLDRAGPVSNAVSEKVPNKGNLKSTRDRTSGIRDQVDSDYKESSAIKREESRTFKVCTQRNGDSQANLTSNLVNSSSLSCDNGSELASNAKPMNVFKDSEEANVKPCSVTGSNGEAGKNEVGHDLVLKEASGKSKFGLKLSDVVKEKNLSEGSASGRNVSKYPSKLHEKLAYLEGKVKRIASDIKRTKEMLDVNNPDASKLILSDIQEKIFGIEKAMSHVVDEKAISHVVDGSDGKKGLSNSEVNGIRPVHVSEKILEKDANHTKSAVNALNTDELEARLFPHHKLLRDRTSKVRPEGLETSDPESIVSSNALKQKDNILSCIDENPIALEFLASLDEDRSKVSTRCNNSGVELCEIQEMDDVVTSTARDASLNSFGGKCNVELILTSNEKLDEFDDQENLPEMVIEEDIEDSVDYQLNEIGRKTCTGGWFVSEGESVILAHDDGSCSFYDIANCEEKAEYKLPVGVSPNVWRDCWIIRAPGADGCSGRYVVAASAGNTMDSGFCSWDFYSKDVRAFHNEDGHTSTRTALAPLPTNTMYRGNVQSTAMASEIQQWWYKPCGPLIVSTASCQRVVKIYDIRDGEQVMKWEVQKPVLAMDYSSPLQWRNREKVLLAESENISLWDVNSQNAEALLTVSSSGRKLSALHVNNTDAEMGGGVRQRVSSSEAEGNDGVFCTSDSINVLDFRTPSGLGLKIPRLGFNVTSVFSRGDSIFLGCENVSSLGKKQSASMVQQFSLRKQRLMATYSLPESNAHYHCNSLTQVWGNSSLAMGVCGLGLHVFDAIKDEESQSLSINHGDTQIAREIIGPDDLYSPSFDFLGSRVLLISRDRPAQWRYLS